jgi:hypothetical protein
MVEKKRSPSPNDASQPVQTPWRRPTFQSCIWGILTEPNPRAKAAWGIIEAMEDAEHLRTRNRARADELATEIGAIRHDLKNILTALRSGCVLIDAKLGGAEHEHQEVRGFLSEMLATVRAGPEIVGRLREVQTVVEELAADESASASGKVAQ